MKKHPGKHVIFVSLLHVSRRRTPLDSRVQVVLLWKQGANGFDLWLQFVVMSGGDKWMELQAPGSFTTFVSKNRTLIEEEMLKIKS